jgi:DNA-binding NarL/FixJ family response regulator
VRSLNILVVDDFEPFRRFVCSILQQRAEFRVIQASDGLEAIQKAEELEPDLILFDVGLPKLNGIEAARRVRQLTSSAKILFLSQESSRDVVQEALSLGALGYVQKLRVQSELQPAIEAVLAGKRFVSGGLQGYEFRDSMDAKPGVMKEGLGRIWSVRLPLRILSALHLTRCHRWKYPTSLRALAAGFWRAVYK